MPLSWIGVDEEFGDEEVAADEEGFEDEYEVFEDAQAGRVFDTMGLKWAETALDLARQVVAQEHMRLLGLELYAFRYALALLYPLCSTITSPKRQSNPACLSIYICLPV